MASASPSDRRVALLEALAKLAIFVFCLAVGYGVQAVTGSVAAGFVAWVATIGLISYGLMQRAEREATRKRESKWKIEDLEAQNREMQRRLDAVEHRAEDTTEVDQPKP